MNKFHKEPYIMHHVYAQYFHPDTLLERVRDVAFYRRPRTIFKGFRVPDWAQNQKMHGWDIDDYSRQAWDNAMHDTEAEWTPIQFAGQRQEPNPLQWFRFENLCGGFGTRLFYNEVPQLSWRRQKGHLTENGTDAERDRMLYSFTHAEQDNSIIWGLDTTTPEGAAAFKAEYEAMCEMAPELLKKEDMILPHQMPPALPNEPYFQRVWQHYREHVFSENFQSKVASGVISREDADKFVRFVGSISQPTFSLFILIKAGKLAHMEHDEGYQATQRVLSAMKLDNVTFNKQTAMPVEEQFWQQYDGIYGLTEKSMRAALPEFVSDPNNQAKVNALLEGADSETTRKLA